MRFQVNNKSGGGGLTAMAYVVEKKGDTHAIAVFTGNWMTNPLVRKEAKYTIKDMSAVSRLVLEPALIAVKADSKFKTLKDLIDEAKKNPKTLKQSGGSLTSRDNVVRQLLMKVTGADWAYVSFKGGGERIAALLGGHVNLMVVEPQEAGEHIKGGNMRVIATVAEKRLAGFPNVPTLKEAGYDVPIVPQVRGIVMPPGVAPDVVAYYEDLFGRMTKTATWKKYIEDQQFEDGYMKAAELSKFFDVFSTQMRGILTQAGIKVIR
ncbi:MAG: Bug family tripartite tricarboxylate transporter substrate binding protein [Burkholderiales bacterium]